jgi:hypothetical protein
MAFDLAGSNLSRPYRLHYAFAASASKRHFLYCGRFCIVRLVGIDRPSSVTEQSELRSHQMSVAGQKPKLLHLSGVSVAPSGANIRRLAQHGRKVPTCDIVRRGRQLKRLREKPPESGS